MSPPLLFLHGWGQSSRIWCKQRQSFAQARFLNLPGHGGAHDAPAAAWIKALASALPETPAVLVGWSLGGMLALEIARRFPARVAALALVSTTPCFKTRPDWPHGCAEDLFSDFELAARGYSAKIMSRFFALMLHGDPLARRDYNDLARECIDRQQPATATGLTEGLSLLAAMDLRPHLAKLQMPAVVMHGEQDAVIPVAAGRALAAALPNSRFHSFSQCGHAPFLTQPELFNETLEAWCQTL